VTRWPWLLLATLAGCGDPEPAPPDARATTTTSSVDTASPDRERGRAIYNYRCYFCHGYSGDARTLASTYLSPQPRDFTAEPARALAPSQLRQAIAEGRPGTAMKAFRGVLSDADIAAVAAFVRHEFIDARAVNTRYHTAANGWPDHERHRAAFPFARGELALDTPWEQLDATQRRGKQLFLTSCISCHDRARVDDAGAVWETRALSYPRDAYCTSCHEHPDGSGLRAGVAPPSDHPQAASTPAHERHGDAALAATYAVHDRRPDLRGASAQVLQGERLYQRNCAFCHAADGSAKSWIGRFLEPHPRDLTDARAMAGMTRERLTRAIADGLDGTSMPAWKSVLRPEEIEAVAAYVERAFIAPPPR
jgi:cytochrome c oxidase cbb3-type subunit 3